MFMYDASNDTMYDFLLLLFSVKFGEASSSSSVARMPGAQAASANEMSAAERGKFYLVPHGYTFYICIMVVLLCMRMIIDINGGVNKIIPFAEYRTHAVDHETGLTLPVARPIGSDSHDDDETVLDCCCNIRLLLQHFYSPHYFSS